MVINAIFAKIASLEESLRIIRAKMSGIYIHVPFCKHKCEYCDFYSEVNLNTADTFHRLIENELKLRSGFLPKQIVETIYFGGGTPSLLSIEQVSYILQVIKKQGSICSKPEVTFEANPDDLSLEYLKELLNIGINRLSIGIQSFTDSDLVSMGRRHNAKQALSSVENAYNAGFKNISIDLMYGLPYSNIDIWKENLRIAFTLPVQHLSCYHLIVEEGTPLSHRVSKGDVMPVNEDDSVEQFQLLKQMAKENGFIHYEISNLAKEGYFSQHNSSYWKQIPYLGLGPSAHSYNGSSREWNPRSLRQWALAINNNKVLTQQEVLSEKDRLNEYLLTSLRTIWGVDKKEFETIFGSESCQLLLLQSEKFIKTGAMINRDDTLRINPKSFLVSDSIISELFQ